MFLKKKDEYNAKIKNIADKTPSITNLVMRLRVKYLLLLT